MHYALTVLDKGSGTQSDAGPINAGGGIVPAGRTLFMVLDNLSDEVTDAHRRSVARDLLSAIDRREQGLEYPWDRVTARGTDGPAVRIDVHDDDNCDCEG